MEQDTVVMQDIYRYEKDGIDENGPGLRQVRGHRRAAGVHAPPGIGRRAPALQRLPRAGHDGGLSA